MFIRLEPSKAIATLLLPLFLTITMVGVSQAEDWLRFRGTLGAGTSTDKAAVPVEWNNDKNMKWKIDLPGPGSSSPIIVGDKVFLTCWTGYGTDARNPGDQDKLTRHLLCFDRKTGKQIWKTDVKAVLPEDNYGGMFAENGYATHTPVSDGKHVYAFFGKSGVYAYDMKGKKVWNVSVGDKLDQKRWGSSSSPILYKNMLIVTASVESQTIFALDKASGKVIWKTPSDMLVGTWGTPTIVKNSAGEEDLVLAVPYEVWGLNPENGKLRWYCETIESNSMCSSAVGVDGIVYVLGGRNGGAVAVKAGGKKGEDIKKNIVWQNGERARIGTPILFDKKMYWITSGRANCLDAATGKKVYEERLNKPKVAASQSTPDAGSQPRRGRRGGGSDYSSPVVADGKMYFVTRKGVAYVVELGSEFKQLAANVFVERGDFSATPAVSKGDLFVRSSKHLYCIGTTKSSAPTKKADEGKPAKSDK